MKDALLDFGSISLATKATAVWSANIIDAGYTHKITDQEGNSPATVIKWIPEANFAAIDSYQPLIAVSPDNSSWITIYTGPSLSAPVKGEIFTAQMPIVPIDYRYIKVGALPGSTGTFTAKAVSSHIEIGGHN